MEYMEFYNTMCETGMLQDHYRHHLKQLHEELKDDYTLAGSKDDVLNLFTIYLSLIDDGNVYMSLDKEVLKRKIIDRIEGLKTSYLENNEISEEGEACDTSPFDKLRDEIENSPILEALSNNFLQKKPRPQNIISTTGDEKLFVVAEEKLFTRKHYNAIKGIRERAGHLFQDQSLSEAGFGPNGSGQKTFKYQSLLKDPDAFQLKKGQEDILTKGRQNNLLVTGGPGTGKTTSVFFLLMALLEDHPEYEIYLAAPSGKAASRMKDSIIENIVNLKEDDQLSGESRKNKQKIQSLEEYTIHRLLGTDFANHGFKYNKKNQFPENSIFVIDEASMIDICLFKSLLEAIPDKARVFIMGDKDQLPSVECGAVFAELLQKVPDQNKVTLTESQRFSDTTFVYQLAKAINEDADLPNDLWTKEIGEFETPSAMTEKEKKEKPIIYYDDGCGDGSGKGKTAGKRRKEIEAVADKWYDAFYRDFPAMCSKLAPSVKKSDTDPDEDTTRFKEISDIAENARILCTDNRSNRGTQHINRYILDTKFAGGQGKVSFYPGELIMVISNNKALNLYNGDNGIVVRFDGDDTLYLMFKKSTTLNMEEGKQDNRYFRIGEYLFYPANSISLDDVVPSFAITVHKSQGSDYNNICVILPERNGHPLLNRQIVYTAITRTKGRTYLISNQKNLEYAKKHPIVRDTGLISQKEKG